MSPNDKVGDVVKRIPGSVRCERRGVHVTSGGRVLRRSEELRSCGGVDGSTVFRVRGDEAEESTRARSKTNKRR